MSGGALRTTVALLCALSVAGCKRVSEDVEVGFQGEARRNSMLATQRLLEHFGAEVEVVRGLRVPEDPATVLVAEGDAFRVRGPRLRALLEFVESGGRALVCLGGFDEAPFDLLGALGEEFEGTNESFAENALLEELDLDLGASYGATDGEAGAPLGHDIDPIISAGLFDDVSPVAVVERGRGAIAVTNSGQYFVNSHLADEDHAGLFMALVGWPDAPRSVVVSFTEPVGLTTLIRDRAPWTLPTGLLLLVLWLWQISRRFGPTLALAEAPTGDLRAHLARVGELLWRADRGALALRSARTLALRRLSARRPDLAHAAPAAITEAVAAELEAPPAEVERALFGSRRFDARALRRAQHILQRITG